MTSKSVAAKTNPKRPPVAIFVPSVVLLLGGTGIAARAMDHLVLVHTAESTPAAVASVGIGAAAVIAALRVYDGRRHGWIAALVLLPIMATVAVTQAQVFNSARPSAMFSAIVAGLAMIFLLLPSARGFVGLASTAAKADSR